MTTRAPGSAEKHAHALVAAGAGGELTDVAAAIFRVSLPYRSAMPLGWSTQGPA